nr:hypothetical protein [Pontibacter sp. 172403-2]
MGIAVLNTRRCYCIHIGRNQQGPGSIMRNMLSKPVTLEPGLQGMAKTSTAALRVSGTLFIATAWLSAALFGLYILDFYAAALYQGGMERWNETLPGLYERNLVTTTSGIGLHFAIGGIILVLGSIQLMSSIRNRSPAVHWSRVYPRLFACRHRRVAVYTC